MKCGVFDSGIGGLSVAGEILKAGLFEEIVYFGDTARVPYGNKNETTIIRYSLEALEFLKNFDIDFLVVACNSASSVAIDDLKKESNFPVLGVISAGVEALKGAEKEANILLIGTKRTISSGKYQTLLQNEGFKNVISVATPLFVPFVEEGIVKGELIKKVYDLYFQNIQKEKIDYVILGCTHYPFLSDSLGEYFPNAKLIHSGQAIVDQIKKRYGLKGCKKTSLKLYASDNPEELRKKAKEWLGFSQV